MTTSLSKITINPKIPAFPIRNIAGFRNGQISNDLDFMKESLRGDWYDFLDETSIPTYNEDNITYTIGIKTKYTCSGDATTLEQYKAEYLKPELSSSKDKSSKVADLEYGLN